MKATTSVLAAASLLAAGASAQNSTNSTMGGGSMSNYTMGLLGALQQNNLTYLAGILQGYPQLASALEGRNYTVFAPSNDALQGLVSAGNSSGLNSSDIEKILMYHISPYPLMTSMLGEGMNHTIIPSLLSEPLLGTNQTAPLVLSLGVDGQPRVRTAAQNVTVGANATYQNLMIHVVDQVINPPMNLTATVAAAGLQGLTQALSAVSSVLPVTALEETPRLTVFVPNDAAFANISSTLATLNASTIATVLANHVINGTVVYSTMISANTTAVSAAGETFSFMIDNGTVYVMSGNMTRAKIVRTDIPVTNGVVHVIDSVLANTMMNPQAAASAASSYAAAAASATPGGVGAAGSTPKSTGAGFQTVVGFSTLAAAVFGAAFAVIA